MKLTDFRTPLIKNTQAAIGGRSALLSGIFMLVSAAVLSVSLPAEKTVAAIIGLMLLNAVFILVFRGYGLGRKSTRPVCTVFIAAVLVLKTLAVVGLLVYMYLYPKRSLSAVDSIFSAAPIADGLIKWAVIGFSAVAVFGLVSLSLFMSAVFSSSADGIPRRKSATASGVSLIAVTALEAALLIFNTLGKSFDSVIDFKSLLTYNFVPAVGAAFFFASGISFAVTCFSYAAAAKRSTNV